MIWESIVGGLLGKVAPEVARHYREKQEQKHAIEMQKLKGKEAWELAKTKRASESEGRDHEWEAMHLADMGRSWKDEWVLGVVSIPAILSFTPWSHWVEQGFAALNTTPYWYQGLLLTIYFAVYGVRVYRRDNAKKSIIEQLGNKNG